MDIERMDRTQISEALAAVEAEESVLEAQTVDAESTVAKLRSQLDALRERKARLYARLAELEGSQRKAAAKAGVSRGTVQQAVSAVRSAGNAGSVIKQLHKQDSERADTNSIHPKTAEVPPKGCQVNLWKILSDMMTRIKTEPEACPTSLAQARKIKRQLELMSTRLEGYIDGEAQN